MNKHNIFKRGKYYWIDFSVNKTRFRHCLINDAGKKITEEKEALLVAQRHIMPYQLQDNTARKQAAVIALQTATEKQQAADKAAKHIPLVIRTLWDVYPYTTNIRGNIERRLATNTIADNKAQWQRFVDWCDNNAITLADDVTSAHVMAFRKSMMEDGLSNDRQNKIMNTCSVMFKLAGITQTPFDNLRKLAHKPIGRRELTPAELQQVFSTADGELKTLLAIGIFTGLRLGDAVLLQWSDIVDNGTIIQCMPNKTAYRHETLRIPVHPELANVLNCVADADKQGYIMPVLAKQYISNKGILSKQIQQHFIACGIQTQLQVSDRRAAVVVGFHSLRHSFISMCARAGVPLHTIRAIVGHASAATQSRYLHTTIDDMQQAIAALPVMTDNNTHHSDDQDALVNMLKAMPADAVKKILAQLRIL